MIYLLPHCCFGERAQYKSTKCVGLVQGGHQNVICSRHDIVDKILILTLKIITHSFLTAHPWLTSKCSVIVSVEQLTCQPRVWENVGSSSSQVKPQTLQLVRVASPLNTQRKDQEQTLLGWIRIRIMCQSGATCLLMSCFSELALQESN